MMENNSSVKHNIKEIQINVKKSANKIGKDLDDIQIMGVTKTVSSDIINIAIESGINLIGENRVQEFLSKYDEYSKSNCQIHFIGKLQTNKVKYIVDKVSMIQSVDSIKLVEEINKQCKKIGKVMDILVEINIGDENSKSGIHPNQLMDFVKEISIFPNIKVKGLMTIPPFSNNYDDIVQYFSDMQKLFIDIKDKKIDNINMDILSMGMSSDYPIAIEYGANLVRIGSLLFGKRIIKECQCEH